MTIEERALKKYPIFISEYSDSCERYDSNESDRLTYIEGATEQHKIDIDKAIEWIKYNNENGGCQFDNWEESFRKVMNG